MAKMSSADLLEAFKEMTLLELSDFVKQFEETFDVKAAAPVAVAAPAAGGARGVGGAAFGVRALGTQRLGELGHLHRQRVERRGRAG